MLSRNRVEEGEVWTGASSFEDNSWRRTLIGETSQIATMQGSQRSKRQNCGAWVQGHRNNVNEIYGNKDHLLPGPNRVNQEGDVSMVHGPGPVFSGLTDPINRKPHHDFFLAGSSGPGSSSASRSFPAENGRLETLMENSTAMLEDMVAVCNSASHLQSARCIDFGPMAANWKANGSGSLRGNRVEVGAPLSGVIFNQGHSALEGSGFIPSLCMPSSLLPVSNEETARFSISGFTANAINNPNSVHTDTSRGRRNSCKRKSSMAEITSFLPLRGSLSCGRWEGNFTRSVEGSGPGRFDTVHSRCPDHDGFQSTNSDHVILPQEKPQYFSDEDNTLQCRRANLAFHGPTESSSRYTGSRSVCMERGQSQSQVHASFVRNSRRMMASVPSQSWISRRMLMNNQVAESAANANNSVVPVVDNQSALAFNPSGMFSVPSTWCINSTYSGTNINHSVFAGQTREGIPVPLEVNQVWNSANGATNWLGITAVDNWYPNPDPTGRALPGMTSRALHAREAHAPHVIANPVVHPGPLVPRSSAHLSGVPSSRRNAFHSQGRLLHRAVSTGSNSVPRAVSANPYPFSDSLHGPCPPIVPSLFLSGEGGLSSSMHNLLRMPFRGLQIAPADGGNRQRFVSEELLDIHDQHSDMRLDVDNMSYEELLALEERIGNVNTGLTDDNITKCLKMSKHSSSDVTVNAISQESEIKCSICQEDYLEEDELGKLDCGHSYHTACIKQWLVQKNQCPICKATAYAE